MKEECLYWYQGENADLKNWVKVFAQRELKLAETIFDLKVIGYSHQIDIFRKSGNSTEILSTKIPNKVVKESLEIPLKQDFQIKAPNFSIKTQKFDLTLINEFLNASNSLFYQFDNDCWTVIIWDISTENINFKTLHTYPEVDLIVLTQSKYPI